MLVSTRASTSPKPSLDGQFPGRYGAIERWSSHADEHRPFGLSISRRWSGRAPAVLAAGKGEGEGEGEFFPGWLCRDRRGYDDMQLSDSGFSARLSKEKRREWAL